MTKRDEHLRSQDKYDSVERAFEKVFHATLGIPINEYRTSPKHKQLREQWIATAFAAIMEEFLDWRLFLRFPAPGEDPPDFVMASERMAHGKHEIASVEIVQVDPFSAKQTKTGIRDLLMQRINAKRTASLNGAWPSDWQLLVYCNVTDKLDLYEVRNALKADPPPFGQVWLMGAGDPAVSTISVWEAWPGEQHHIKHAVPRRVY